MTRHAALRSGIPQEKPALTVNRLCGSGFQSIVNGCQVWTSLKRLFSPNDLLNQF